MAHQFKLILGMVVALICRTITPQVQAKDPKLLVLIITSDNFPIYKELQALWKLYMQYDPEHVEAYFIRGEPTLASEYRIDGDTVWCKCDENPLPGLMKKTIIALEAFADRMDEFDYVLRTNLSSFYIFPRLLNVLRDMPREQLFFGSAHHEYGVASGSGLIVSKDLVSDMVRNRSWFFNNMTAYDDQLIGYYMRRRGVRLIAHDRINFYHASDWQGDATVVPEYIFQCRIKNDVHDLRNETDALVYRGLIKKFYQL